MSDTCNVHNSLGSVMSEGETVTSERSLLFLGLLRPSALMTDYGLGKGGRAKPLGWNHDRTLLPLSLQKGSDFGS